MDSSPNEAMMREGCRERTVYDRLLSMWGRRRRERGREGVKEASRVIGFEIRSIRSASGDN